MPTKTIASRDNPWLKRFRRAAEKHDEEIVLEGRKQLADAIRSGLVPIAVAASDPRLFNEIPSSAALLELAPPLLASLSSTVTDQGIIALAARPDTSLGRLQSASRLLVLDRVQDPANAGALFRLAAAFGCDGVIATTGCADPFSPKSLRAAAGTTFLLPVALASAGEAIAFCEEAELPLVAADGRATRDAREANAFRQRFALVVGSEGEGLSAAFREAAELFRIPIDRRVESLNVAAAAAIFLWELSG